MKKTKLPDQEFAECSDVLHVMNTSFFLFLVAALTVISSLAL